MTWKLVGNPKTVKITKNLANEFAKMDAAIHDRPLSERRLQVYERLAMENNFRPVSWAKAYCKETGQTYRVNGKHTSTMFSGLLDRDDYKHDAYAVVEIYECTSLDDVAKLYATYDSKLQARTASDINQSFASCVKGLEGISVRQINLAVSAISYAEFQDAYSTVQAADRAEKLLDASGFVLWMRDLLGYDRKVDTKHLARVPVMGAARLTYLKNQKHATEFWNAVRDDTDPQPNMPTRKLSRFLLTKMVGGTHRPEGRFRTSSREFFVKSIHSWNAWRAGETTQLNYYARSGIPDVK